MNDELLTSIADETYGYLTTTGRKTGEPHRIEIWFGVENGRIFLMAGARDRSDWVKNLMANPGLTIEIADHTIRGTAKILEADTLDDALARALLVSKYQKTDELQVWGRDSLAVLVEIESNESN